MNRRQFIWGTSALAAFAVTAAEKTTDGGLAEVDWPARRRKTRPVLPPGAHGVGSFAAKCVGCGLCMAGCPSKCLRVSTDPSRLGRVELDFRHGWCRPECTACAEACPTGAIEVVPKGNGASAVHVGYAVWQRQTCIRVTEGVDCHACEKHCPVRAVKLIGGVPVVDRTACIGCGACEHYCPARPLTAIHVEGCERHREYVPISQVDLLDEMKRQLEAGHSAVIARDGVIVMTLDGRGLKPIVDVLAADEGVFSGAVIADKVVGVKAAEIYVRGHASSVFGRVMSEGAKSLLDSSRIAVSFDTLVPRLDCE